MAGTCFVRVRDRLVRAAGDNVSDLEVLVIEQLMAVCEYATVQVNEPSHGTESDDAVQSVGESGNLAEGCRLAALAASGLTAAGDERFDRFASLVRTVLKVPVALVSLVETDRQVFPGATGLPDPWQYQRQTPLSHSFCQHVVRSGQPLIVADARVDERVAGNLAIADLHVIAYAGMPLTDGDARVLGSLCAIDSRPRRWSEAELGLLADLAAACSDSLRLRIATRNARAHERTAATGRRQADAVSERSQLLLRASVALSNTTTLDDVVHVVRELVIGTLNPAYVGLSLLDEAGWVGLQSGASLPVEVAQRWNRYPSSAAAPSALAVATGAPVLLPDLAAVAAAAPNTLDTFTQMGWQAAASVPLPGAAGPVGALTFVWKQPNALDAAEQTVLAALGGYVGQAVHRAQQLTGRQSVAALLQQAMLTDLPDVSPLEVAACYKPAAQGEQVGGDWYDLLRLDADQLALVIGDVTGHDMLAASRMGQLRSILRGYLIDRHEPPSALLRRLDHANQVLGEGIPTTAVLAYIQPETDSASYRMQWANAGHPTPLLLLPDGTVSTLEGRDALLGVLRRTPRANHTRILPPGSTLMLYTDGLIETRTEDLDHRKHQLRTALADLTGTPLPHMLNTLLDRLAGSDHEDDIAMLAIRIPPS